MNIVVCVKYVPDAQSDRGFNEDNTTDREGVDGLLSELDEYAVEGDHVPVRQPNDPVRERLGGEEALVAIQTVAHTLRKRLWPGLP